MFLVDCRLSLVPLKKTEPEMRLPPVFGTTFIVRPPVSDSPSPPDVDEGHFLGVADVGHVRRRLVAARRVADVQSVDRHAAFVVAAAMDRELCGRRVRRRCH